MRPHAAVLQCHVQVRLCDLLRLQHPVASFLAQACKGLGAEHLPECVRRIDHAIEHKVADMNATGSQFVAEAL